MLSDSALRWLQSLFRERIHAQARLWRRPDAALVMTIEGNDGWVRFAEQFDAFESAAADAPCAWWDSRAEGWSSALGFETMPAPCISQPLEPLVRQEAGGWWLGYDLPSLFWWALSRKEEVGDRPRDGHDRFPAAASHALRHGYLDRPVVDEWVQLLRQIAARCWPQLTLTRSEFRMCPSHDVDFPSRYAFRTPSGVIRELGIDLLRRHRPLNLLTAAGVLLGSGKALRRSDPANTFDWLMDLSERHGARSAFYFICGRTAPAMDAAYEPEDRAIRALLSEIHARGHEIGLHPSYGTYLEPGRLAEEAARLRRVCDAASIEQDTWGGRMHYLRWRTPATLYGWQLAGMNYDSTLGYADHVGFRCGTCHEYQAFDPVADCALDLRIRPLVAMEGTVMSSQYMGLGTGAAAFAALAALKDRCRAVGGQFTLLWHNSELGEPPLRDLYRAVIEH